MSTNKDLELRKLFVGGIKADTSDEDFRNFFSRFGQIEDIVQLRSKETKQSKGFGFVTFSKIEEVDYCLSKKPHCINGKEVDTKRAVPKNQSHARCQKIFVGGLPETNEKEIKEFFEQYGKVTQCQMKRDQASGRSRGFGFVQFEDCDAVDKIVITRFHQLNGKTVECKKALDLQDKQTVPSNGGNAPAQSQNPSVYNAAPPVPPQPNPGYHGYPMYPAYGAGYPSGYPAPSSTYPAYPVPPTQPPPPPMHQTSVYPAPAYPQHGPYSVPQPYCHGPNPGLSGMPNQPVPGPQPAYPCPAQQQAPSSYGAQKNTYTSHTYNSSRSANYKPY